MGLLSTVTTGKQIGAQIHVIAGNNGVGKTTWATAHPNSLLADLENGSSHLDVARIPHTQLQSLEAVRSVIKELLETNHGYKNFVIDSVESLESLVFKKVCLDGNVDSIEKYDGGYGKGYTRSREIMTEIMSDLQRLKEKGISSILIAHTQVKTVSDPATNQTYDRVIMRCNDKMAAIIRDLSDNVFYATYKVLTTKDNGKTKAFGDGQRVMYTQWRPGFDAKNRLELPLELPLSYEDFAAAADKKSEIDTNELMADIVQMSHGVDKDLKASVNIQVEKFKTNPAKLREIKNRLMKYVAKGA